VRRDLVRGEALRVERQHRPINPGQPALPLLDDLRLERSRPIARHVNPDRPGGVGQDRLGPAPVADVAAVRDSRVVLVTAEMRSESSFRAVSKSQPLRVLATPLASAGPVGRPAVLVVAVRRDQRDEALRELIAQLVFANLAALAIASLIGYRLARAALDPVERYRAQSARVAAGATGVRLDIPAGDDELTRLGRTLNDMLTALDTALERERRFVSDACHELRTPLTLLAAELELALRRPRSAAELEAALRAAATDTAGLIALADTLLAVGVQAAPDAATPTIDPAQAIPAIAKRYWNGVNTDLQPTPLIRVEPTRLERIVTNLLDNASRHGALPITVATGTVDGYARLTVHDSGPGMPAEFLPHAAERFARADTARTTPGTGLGLSLVDAIVAVHHGYLWWCSGTTHHHRQSVPVPCTHPGTGTTVTVLLPADDRAHRCAISATSG
jgi:two-component system, OmpR family, sensor kinase